MPLVSLPTKLGRKSTTQLANTTGFRRKHVETMHILLNLLVSQETEDPSSSRQTPLDSPKLSKNVEKEKKKVSECCSRT